MNRFIFYKFRILAIIFLEVTIVSCQLKRSQASTELTTSVKNSAVTTRFPYPDIPPVIVNPEERADYLVRHYWEKFDFTDTLLMTRPEIAEQGMVDFLDLLVTQVTPKTAQEGIREFCHQFTAHRVACQKMPEIIQKYLYEPNSPLYNESLFATFLTAMNQEESMQSNPARTRWDFLLQLIKRNNPGNKASDFTYYSPQEKPNTLYHTKGNLTILFFYDPQCENCRHTLWALKNSRELATATEKGEITVLAIYTEENEDIWKATLDRIPKNWLSGTDHGYIQTHSLYDLKAMPTLYLLDRSKKVILKDATYEEILSKLGFSPITK